MVLKKTTDLIYCQRRYIVSIMRAKWTLSTMRSVGYEVGLPIEKRFCFVNHFCTVGTCDMSHAVATYED